MTNTLRLLKFDPAVALLIMVNNDLLTDLMTEHASIGVPEVVNGSLTKVVITTHDSTDEVIYRRHTGSLEYQYHRLDVADIFGTLNLDMRPPRTVYGILNVMSQASGFVWTSDDFENAVVDKSSFILKAKSKSLRWIGQVEVAINDPQEEESLSDAFPYNILNGLYPPDFSEMMTD